MKLTSNETLKMLENVRKKFENDAWINHSIQVGEISSKIAKELNLDYEKAKTLGLIHDIGKSVGPFKDHVINGYNYLKDLGYDEEYCNICLVHPYLNNDINCTAVPCNDEKISKFLKNHKYTIYEKIINLTDLLCTDKVCTLEDRLLDIEERYGTFPNTDYHKKEIYKLKDYFDELLGYDLYELLDLEKNK